jgi:hypothetical protein
MGRYLPVRRVSTLSRLVALFLSTTIVFTGGVARSEPGDIFTLGAPVIGSPPPKATPIADGDASVSTQTGALQYSYPIAVPHGRGGMQPHLALSYSSQAPIYGGVAAGWTLSGIPIISEDTSKGTLWKQQYGKRYVSSLAGGRPLVAVTEAGPSGPEGNAATFRAQNDSTFARYQQLFGDDAAWKVYTTDGTVYSFGQLSHAGSCTIFSDGYAPLTQHSDSFGNIIDYVYNGRC